MSFWRNRYKTLWASPHGKLHVLTAGLAGFVLVPLSVVPSNRIIFVLGGFYYLHVCLFVFVLTVLSSFFASFDKPLHPSRFKFAVLYAIRFFYGALIVWLCVIYPKFYERAQRVDVTVHVLQGAELSPDGQHHGEAP